MVPLGMTLSDKYFHLQDLNFWWKAVTKRLLVIGLKRLKLSCDLEQEGSDCLVLLTRRQNMGVLTHLDVCIHQWVYIPPAQDMTAYDNKLGQSEFMGQH